MTLFLDQQSALQCHRSCERADLSRMNYFTTVWLLSDFKTQGALVSKPLGYFKYLPTVSSTYFEAARALPNKFDATLHVD